MSLANPPQGRIISPKNITGAELIGQGSFGKVYKATWTGRDEDGDEFEQEVAVKVMHSSTKERVLQERDRMAGLCHPNIVHLLGFVQRLPIPWLVMEYMECGDLKQYLDHYNLDAEFMMTVAWNVAKGLRYLHGRGIMHGDLAARNILLDDAGVAKIGDLGYFDDSNSQYYNNYLGSSEPCPIRWMSPENLPWKLQNGYIVSCAAKRSYDGDVWAFGVILYELWSRGETPFADIANNQKVASVVLQRKKPTDYHSVKMREHMRQLMHACWQYDPKYRPGTSTLVEHFEKYCDFEPESFSEDDDEEDSDDDNYSNNCYGYASSSSSDYY